MAKQWSMDEIDNLLETTQENGVSDLVAELMGEPAAAEQADPVDEATLPVLDEEDDFDDDYDYDYDDFDYSEVIWEDSYGTFTPAHPDAYDFDDFLFDD